MGKIKKISLINLKSTCLTKPSQKNLRGGCSCNGSNSNWGNPSYCGGGPSTCDNYTCMPGDRADVGSWIGTSIANKYL